MFELAYIILLILISTGAEQDECDFDPGWKPILYSIRISTNVTNKRFDGSIQIEGVITRPTDHLKFHSFVNITTATYKIKGGAVKMPSLIFNETSGILKIHLDETVVKGVEIVVSFNYYGAIREINGVYFSNYVDNLGYNRTVISTELQPTYARYVFPCLDEPQYKSAFELELARPEKMIALSNTPIKSTSAPDSKINDQVWVKFYTTPKMSTYTFAFVISNFDAIKLIKNNTFYMPRDIVDESHQAIKIAPVFLETVQSFTGVPYPLTKLDHFVVPNLRAVAMENWGLITYRQNLIQLKKEISTISNEMSLLSYVAHEIIHQWFGNLVTCASWSYTWLNEGVATYLMSTIVEKAYPRSYMSDLFAIHEIQQVLFMESLTPISLTSKAVCSSHEIATSFRYSSYHKGAAILKMVESFVTKDSVNKGLIRLLKRNKFGLATETDLWESIAITLQKKQFPPNETLSSVMKSWTHAKGYPFITVRREGRNITLSQAPFTYYAVPTEPVKWWIPLTYTTSNEKNFEDTNITWYKNETTNILVDENEWVIFNLKRTGFYRVNYDRKSWQLIVNQLKNKNINDIHPLNRAQIIDDQSQFAVSGFMTYIGHLDTLQYLIKETNYYPWSVAIKALESINAWLYGSTVLIPFRKFLHYLIKPIFEKVTSFNYKVETPQDRLLLYEVVMFACKMKYPLCLDEAVASLKIIRENSKNEYRINADLKKVMYCSAVARGGSEEWEFVKTKYIAAKDTDLKSFYFDALSCTEDEKTAKSLLKEIFEKKDYVKKVSILNIVNSLYKDETSCAIIDFYEENYDEIVKSYSENSIRGSLEILSLKLLPESCRHKLKSLNKKFPKLAPFVRESNIWLNSYGVQVKNWLDEFDFKEPKHGKYIKKSNFFLDTGVDFYTTFHILD